MRRDHIVLDLMEPAKSVPPAFIIESCMLLDMDAELGQRQIPPDMLRRVRMGEADEADLQQVNVASYSSTYMPIMPSQSVHLRPIIFYSLSDVCPMSPILTKDGC